MLIHRETDFVLLISQCKEKRVGVRKCRADRRVSIEARPAVYSA